MKEVYIPNDIPLTYKYFQMYDGYIDLFENNHYENQTVMAYRVYYDYSDNLYAPVWHTYATNNIYYPECTPTHNLLSMHNIDKVLTCVFILVFFFVFLLNIFSSIVKKGGVFSGLL